MTEGVEPEGRDGDRARGRDWLAVTLGWSWTGRIDETDDGGLWPSAGAGGVPDLLTLTASAAEGCG